MPSSALTDLRVKSGEWRELLLASLKQVRLPRCSIIMGDPCRMTNSIREMIIHG